MGLLAACGGAATRLLAVHPSIDGAVDRDRRIAERQPGPAACRDNILN